MKSMLLQLIKKQPLFKIIDFLVENKGKDFTKKDIIEGVEISRATLFKYWNPLEEHEIVKITRRFGKTKLYILNSGNLVVKRILDLEKALIKQSLTKQGVRK